VSRRQRQLDALRDLCRAGAVDHAVDLAFEHFAAFGRDDEIVDVLGVAIDEAHAAEELCRRFAELRASRRSGG
jgi:uncharacterized protein (DUF111 family)